MAKNDADDEIPCGNCDLIRGDAVDNQSTKLTKELQDAKLLINAMETQQLHLIGKLESPRLLINERALTKPQILGDDNSGLNVEGKFNREPVHANQQDTLITSLQNKLNVMSKELEHTIQSHSQYQENNKSELFQRNHVDRDKVLEQVEIETAETILHLQEEVATLQSELQDRLSCMAHENMDLRNKLAAKDFEMKELTMKWEKATLELTSFLIDGCQSLTDVSAQIEEIAYSFPQIDGWINAQVMKAAKVCIKKEETLLSLQRSLEDAQLFLLEIEMKISSLKGASLALDACDKLDASEGDNAIMQHVKLELLETNQKLSIIGSSLKSLSKIYNKRTNMESLEPGECGTETDYSSSSSESSAAYVASDNEKTCSPDLMKGYSDQNFTVASSPLSPMHESNSLKMNLHEPVRNEMITIDLEKELKQTKDAFRKLCAMLANRFDVEGVSYKLIILFSDHFYQNLRLLVFLNMFLLTGWIDDLPCTGTKRKRARTSPDSNEVRTFQPFF